MAAARKPDSATVNYLFRIPATVVLFVISLSIPGSALTRIEGDISGVTFADTGNPYIVTADIFIPESSKVIIGKGCILLFEAQTGLKISGVIEVQGDSTAPVVFTSRKDQTYDTAATEPANPFDWNGITIEKGAPKTVLTNFKLLYSVFGIKCFNNNLLIENGLFRQNGQSRLVVGTKPQPVEENTPVTLSFLPQEPPKSVVKSTIIGSGDATLYIESEPDSASVVIENTRLDRLTPLRIDSILPGQYTIKATRGEFTASKSVVLESGGVKRLVLKLEKRKTTVRIITEPLDAEVYVGRMPAKRAKPDLLSPGILENVPDTKALRFAFFKPGYRDTTVQLSIVPNQLNNVYVDLVKADDALIAAQNKFIRGRNRVPLAKFFYIGSAPFFLGGAYAGYKAWNEYGIARTAKEYLENTVERTGSTYESKIVENRNHISYGDWWRALAIGAGAVGCALLGTGLVLYF